jgi:hypothetical protein
MSENEKKGFAVREGGTHYVDAEGNPLPAPTESKKSNKLKNRGSSVQNDGETSTTEDKEG